MKSAKLTLYFENGIMSLPRLLPGTNYMRFRLRDTAAIQAPIPSPPGIRPDCLRR